MLIIAVCEAKKCYNKDNTTDEEIRKKKIN